MVGDRDYDIAAALRHRVTPIGVLWGFGSRDELVSSGAAAVVSHAYELLTLSVSPTFGPSNAHYAGTAE
jgi:phosphoglycolate phosphatase